ncbi:MAG: carbohydrate kinase [Candidatus Thiodiazotropha lotti]|uniref:carbohydrate kinase family protein n=1 Tax=Candidatus Thiodiazotropha endoloripes TaxID=1818881 RepID=UPI00083D80C3|nr:carbohydrate kinase [Candidatus Thiodiazotropha endoloripes]MCG7993138.1 carbohydrate kinase [Candidatus Thiodiazotropha lotti]MCW4184800.1 carbohydrate kinase [Candidatus Thiodiazotropha weberae]MCG8000744.1 carbohydrate kinase [Candidatus Thiodiazotropha lotti]MCW4192517.1 carbohydrate kinase [Candidatus Thiodiazotropha weberae]ODB94633.1 carbohydrate kinase [Candidatus Thiodiazotropha endoloripes]
MNNKKLIIYGEVLYDCFPNGEQVLGGAPFNVAWHLQAFGQSPYFVSRVGRDAEGERILQSMADWGMETAGVQQDDEHPTGRVVISLEQGEPSYEIMADAAYDFIDSTALNSLGCEMLYHGSLGLRNTTARSALERLKQNGAESVFLDVNLRPPWWQRESVMRWINQADWLKLNQHELDQLDGGAGDLHEQALAFKQKHDLTGLIVTMGEQGAFVLSDQPSPLQVIPEASQETVDSVGAGDAFTAVMLLGLNSRWPLKLTLQRAQSFASAIVGKRGATVSSAKFYADFISRWESQGSNAD